MPKTGLNPNVHQPVNGHKEILLSNKKEWPRMQTTWTDLKHMMLGERIQTSKTPQCMIPFIWHSEKDKNCRDKKTHQPLPGPSGEERGWTNGEEETLRVMKMFSIFTWLYTFVKIHKNVHIKRVNLTVCKLCLSKPD